ncbi:MAG: autotransporter assembly complex protein TamA [Paracoccaceae bacterium]|nr:autotransporter assembly complex protein TamA [Paracoccaceae bacterium]
MAVAMAQSLAALDFSFETPGASDSLRSVLRGASLTREASQAKAPDAQDLFASARADYARLLGALYDQGYYSGRISIRVDGREVAAIAPMDAPDTINTISVTVEPGPQFHFGTADIAPLAPKTTLPQGFATGATARSGLIVEAATAGVDGWRAQGHAKAKVSSQSLSADHRTQTLDAHIGLAPGPQLSFGKMSIDGYDRLRPKRLVEIAGFPTGKRFDPAKLEEVRARLRRTGIFSSVTLTEDEAIGPNNTLDASLNVVEDKTRRLGFGAELASLDGLTLNGYWLHRNLFHGGERLRLDAEVSGIGTSQSGMDYTLGARLDRPATLSPDTSAYLETALSRLNQDDYTEDAFKFGLGFDHIFNPRLTGSAGVEYNWSKVEDDVGTTIFRQVAFPIGLTWDNRDTPTDATRGYYGKATLTPFLGLSGTGSGAQMTGDFRTYRGFGAQDRFVLAGRLQFGAVFGPSLEDTPRDYLFYSGGGGTVRGQPYQSLGVTVLNGGTLRTGGTQFLGLSGELRAGITDTIGVVGFYDAGFISADGPSGSVDDWHAGAGLGLRYKTSIGPIRLDVAAPAGGNTGSGAQLYLGIGQAF